MESSPCSVDTAHISQGVLDAKSLLIVEEIAIDDMSRTWHLANRNLGTLTTERNARFEITMFPFGCTALIFS